MGVKEEIGAQLDITMDMNGRNLALPDLLPFMDRLQRMVEEEAAKQGMVVPDAPRYYLNLTRFMGEPHVLLRALADAEPALEAQDEIPAEREVHHYPTEVANPFGGYNCQCGGAWLASMGFCTNSGGYKRRVMLARKLVRPPGKNSGGEETSDEN